MEAADLLVRIAWMFYGAAALIAGGIALGLPVARWLGNRLGQLLSGWSDEKFDEPPPRLAMAASLAAHGDLEGALTFYEELMEDYPQEEEVYHRMLEIALGPLDRPTLAEEILQRGLSTLENERAHAPLVRLFEELKAGTYRPMSYLRKTDDARGTAFPSPRNVPVPPALRPLASGGG